MSRESILQAFIISYPSKAELLQKAITTLKKQNGQIQNLAELCKVMLVLGAQVFTSHQGSAFSAQNYELQHPEERTWYRKYMKEMNIPETLANKPISAEDVIILFQRIAE